MFLICIFFTNLSWNIIVLLTFEQICSIISVVGTYLLHTPVFQTVEGWFVHCPDVLVRIQPGLSICSGRLGGLCTDVVSWSVHAGSIPALSTNKTMEVFTMDSIWLSFLDLFRTVIEVDGVPFVEVSEAVCVCFLLCIVCFGDLIFNFFVGFSVLTLIKALVQRFIYPGIKNNRMSSGSAPDENTKNIKLKGKCKNEKND